MSYLKQLRHYFVRVKQSYFPKKLSKQEIDFISEHLSPQFVNLYFEQALCDQRHGLLVYEKCKSIFNNSISDEDLLLVSTMHDIAKAQSFKNVTLRIITALLLTVLKDSQISNLSKSKSKFFNKVAIYANHSDLSAEIIKNNNNSKFVYEATKYHHSSKKLVDTVCQYGREVNMFIEADTL